VAGVAYRTSTDYRNSGAYQESSVTVSPSTIACTATVPAVTVTAFANAAAVVIAGTTTVPATTVTGTANVSPSVIATSATTPSATISGTASVAPSVIAGVATTPSATISGTASVAPSVISTAATTPSVTVTGDAGIAPSVITGTSTVPSVIVSMDQNITATVIQATTSVDQLLFRKKYVPVFENTVPTLDVTRFPVISPARNLRRFYPPTARGVNIFILNDGSVTTRQPADVSTVSRTIYGGHESPTDFTDEELNALKDAGYGIEVEGYATV
jgi:hypothetical protein